MKKLKIISRPFFELSGFRFMFKPVAAHIAPLKDS